MLKLLTVAALVATTGLAAQCPSNVPTYTGQISQLFNGQSSPYAWTISPTSTTSTAPSGSQACPAPGYISQYDVNGGCQANINQQTAAPQVIMNACKYSFSDGGTRAMTLTLSCDPSANVMQMTPTVPVTVGTGSMYTYAFSGKYAGVCGSYRTTAVPLTTASSSTPVGPSFEASVTSLINASVVEVFNEIVDNYAGRVTSLTYNTDGTFTVYVYFYTDAARSTFVTAVNNHEVAGSASAAPVTSVPTKDGEHDKNYISIFIGVTIGSVALIAVVVGILVYVYRIGRREDTQNVYLEMNLNQETVHAKNTRFG